MSTITGNVKISELDKLGAIDDGDKVIIPVSKDTTDSGWESNSVSASVLANFMDTKLELNDVGTTKGFKHRVTDLESGVTGLKSDVTDLENHNAELNKILGNYNIKSKHRVFKNQLNCYVSKTGVIKSDSYNYGLYISSLINLSKGKLYILNTRSINSYPADISIISKVSTKGNQTVYEPLSTYYNDKGVPNGYLVFFATEYMNVVISTRYDDIEFYSVDYGFFFEIADKLLTLNGEMMKVLVEAIVKNNKDIESLQEKVKDINKGHFESIDCDKCPSIQGEPMVVISDRDPGTPLTDENRVIISDPVGSSYIIGQIWINRTNGNIFICTASSNSGSANSWAKISLTYV